MFLKTLRQASEELQKNRRPTLPICADAGDFLIKLSKEAKAPELSDWFDTLKENENDSRISTFQ